MTDKGVIKSIYETVLSADLRFNLEQKFKIAAAQIGVEPYFYSNVFTKTHMTQGATAPTETRVWVEAMPIDCRGGRYLVTLIESERSEGSFLATPARAVTIMKDGESLHRPAVAAEIVRELEASFAADGYKLAEEQPFASLHANNVVKPIVFKM